MKRAINRTATVKERYRAASAKPPLHPCHGSEALRAKSQQTLIELINTELKLVPTFVQTASLAKSEGHLEHYRKAKHDAVKAARSARRFMGQVEDATVKAEIGRQLAELDRLISTLAKS
jgi:hypothetical protein